jgi:DNA invertase Pin-like site-specific DNA recombinase
MKLVAYLRVSTETQADNGLGLEVQEQSVRQWAKANGHRLVAVYKDAGVSGSNGLGSRVGLPDALHALESGEAEGLVVAKLDRLARDLMVQETTLAKVWKMGGAVFSVDQGEILQDDPDDPMRTAFRQIVGVFSQLERSMIAARLRAGKKLKAEGGGYVGGMVAYGYRAENGELVEYPKEQAALARIWQLRLSGLSLSGIATELEAEGIAPRDGGKWALATLGRIVKRDPSPSPLNA